MKVIGGGGMVKLGRRGETEAQREGIGKGLLETSVIVKEVQGADEGSRRRGGDRRGDEKAGQLKVNMSWILLEIS